MEVLAMIYIQNPSVCPEHGVPKNRESCHDCNAAYMRDYYRRRNRDDPQWAIWQRAKKRADKLQLPFNLPLKSIVIPHVCPILGTALVVGEGRVPASPSLDRVIPQKGYVVGNCRVISDHANRLKSNLDRIGLSARAKFGTPDLRGDYAKIVEYIDREELLAEVREKAAAGGRVGTEWAKIAAFLEARFASGQVL
jgi:hypothetical protein